jgi:hypothetical protein
VAVEIEPGTDSVRAYPAALRDAARRLTLGSQPGAALLEEHWIV